MIVVKIIIGTLAVLFALAHCVMLPMNLMRGVPISGLMGNVAGICIGAIIGVLLFRSAFSRPGDEPPS